MWFERVLFKRVEVWLVLLLLVLVLPGIVLFGEIVKSEAVSRQYPDRPSRWGTIGDAAYFVADLPEVLKSAMETGSAFHAGSARRLADIPSGWSQVSDGPALSGYLLFSRIDGDLGRTVVELVDLSDFSVLHRWLPAPETLFAGLPRTSKIVPYAFWSSARFRAMHPLLEADGSLVMHGQTSPLMRLSPCGDMLWMQDDIMLHHSLNRDAEGNYWSPGFTEPTELGLSEKFHDDTLVQISPEGEILFTRSLTQLLIDHGHEYMVYQMGEYREDPLHLNDIQPVLSDGPYWKTGDLLISARDIAAILLYRPSTDEILWMKRGPWMAQHDVDILGPTTISVFNNNVRNRGAGAYIDTTSNVLVYDLESDTVTSPYQTALEEAVVLATTNGLSDMTESGHLIVEEDTAGRLLVFGPDRALAWQYMNRDAAGTPYRMAWSRYVPKALGDQARAALAAASCPAP
ncbi:arylsulfotransferase family protein [Meridianimarinicoccus sp. MJW13]|uniref:arylsulfotransferase family protein n=1 Tax=Meridianimarinicoccus sp. MJW13 TaxID=2720031 RepID=UPI00186685F9|nr:arylsulfotransferase family protein [Fluviibacterium sp. MJW13]